MAVVKGENELITTNVFELINLEKGMSVADLGCGNLGFFTFAAAKIVNKSGVVYAVDILKSALTAVESKAKELGLNNVKTVWSNLEVVGAAKIPDNSIDVAFLHNVLFQSDKDDLVMQEAYRLLKTGAKLMVVDWIKNETPFGPPLNDRLTPEQVKTYGIEAKLKVLQEFSAGPYHYGIIFVK